MITIAGRILTENGLKKGYITCTGSTIHSLEFGSCPITPDQKGIITPTFVNMHTHLGDAFIAEKHIPLPHDIMQLVAPPDGIKHQQLNNSTDEEIITGMKNAINAMLSYGTTRFVDFRENGQQGIDRIKKALQDFSIESSILSRPKSLIYDKKEVEQLLRNSDGIGLSSISDWNYEDIEEIADQTKQQHKLFAIHASERIREDIDNIIALKPDFIIHMVKGTKQDLQKIKDAGIPIVLCPRSNTFFRLKPPIKLMKTIGNTLLIGTDNAMLHPPYLLDEIYHLKTIEPGLFTIEELLTMITSLPRKVLNPKEDILDASFSSSYVVLDERTLQAIVPTILFRDG